MAGEPQNNNTAQYYKEMYERELKKNEELTQAVVRLEAENADLSYKLDKVRKSKLWKAIYPVRLLWSHTKNLFIRVKSYGN
nr:hypothetical protein [Lachnospiraceae bacterium]